MFFCSPPHFFFFCTCAEALSQSDGNPYSYFQYSIGEPLNKWKREIKDSKGNRKMQMAADYSVREGATNDQEWSCGHGGDGGGVSVQL